LKRKTLIHGILENAYKDYDLAFLSFNMIVL